MFLSVCLAAAPALAAPVPSAPATPVNPIDREVPAIVDGEATARSLRSFLSGRNSYLLIVLETANCELCDRSAPANRALGDKVGPSDAKLVHIVYGPVGNLESLVKTRAYKHPVLFDLDGSLVRRYGLDPAKSPSYVIVDRDEDVVMNISGQSANPAAVQTAVLTALLIRKTQGAAEAPKAKQQKPATPRKP